MPELPRVDPAIERIVSSIFELPTNLEEYLALRSSLRSEERASSLSAGKLMDLLDRAADNAQRAVELLAGAKAALEDYELGYGISMAVMHRQASEALLEEKDDRKEEGKSTKRINKEDVLGAVRNMFPDECAHLERERARLKNAVRVVESLADRLAERERDLRAMVAARRGE